VVAGAVGLPLTLIFDGGALLAVGVVALLASVALASIAIATASTAEDTSRTN